MCMYAYQVNPKAAYNNVVYSGDSLSPGVVALGAVKHKVAAPNWIDSQILPPEL